MGKLLSKLVVSTLSGLMVLVLGAIILNKLGLSNQPGSLATNLVGSLVSATSEALDRQSAARAPATASSQATGETALPKELSVPEASTIAESIQANSAKGPPSSSPDEQVSNSDDGVCRPRVMMIQDRTWPRMQRFLDPDNQDCLIVADQVRLSVTIQSCGGRIANTGYLNIVADYRSAFVGVSENMNAGYRGIVLVRELDGYVPSKEMTLKGSFLNVTITGIGGEFCGIDMQRFTPYATSVI